MAKWRCRYYYLATGMEGIPDIDHKCTIEAPTREAAKKIWLDRYFRGEDDETRAWCADCFQAKEVLQEAVYGKH